MLSKTPEDDLRWLKYWIIVSVFMVVQIPADWVLAWAPGFSIGINDLSLVNISALGCQHVNILMSISQHVNIAVKILFLLWCMAPLQENGSVVLFKLVC